MENEQRKLIKQFYQHMGDSKFLRILESYVKGEGYGTEYARFVFADYYDEWEEEYFGDEGIAYYVDSPIVEVDAELILDYSTFYKYLKEDSEEYIKRKPQDKVKVEKLLNEIKEKYKISA